MNIASSITSTVKSLVMRIFLTSFFVIGSTKRPTLSQDSAKLLGANSFNLKTTVFRGRPAFLPAVISDMASNGHRRMSVLDSDFPDFVNSVLDDYEGSDASDCEIENDPDYNSEHDTHSEQEDDSEEEVDAGYQRSSLYLYGKNGFKWCTTEPNKNRRTPAHNIPSHFFCLRSTVAVTCCTFTSSLLSVAVTETAVFVVVLLEAVVVAFLVTVLVGADLMVLVALTEVFVTPVTLFVAVVVALFVAVTVRDDEICLFAVSFTCFSVTSFASRVAVTLLRAVAVATVPVVRGLAAVPFTAPGFGRGAADMVVVRLVVEESCFVVVDLVAAGAVAGRLGGLFAAVVDAGFLAIPVLAASPLVRTADLEVVVVVVLTGLVRGEGAAGFGVVGSALGVGVDGVFVPGVAALGLAVVVDGDFVTLLAVVVVVVVGFFGVDVRAAVVAGFVGEVTGTTLSNFSLSSEISSVRPQNSSMGDFDSITGEGEWVSFPTGTVSGVDKPDSIAPAMGDDASERGVLGGDRGDFSGISNKEDSSAFGERGDLVGDCNFSDKAGDFGEDSSSFDNSRESSGLAASGDRGGDWRDLLDKTGDIGGDWRDFDEMGESPSSNSGKPGTGEMPPVSKRSSPALGVTGLFSGINSSKCDASRSGMFLTCISKSGTPDSVTGSSISEIKSTIGTCKSVFGSSSCKSVKVVSASGACKFGNGSCEFPVWIGVLEQQYFPLECLSLEILPEECLPLLASVAVVAMAQTLPHQGSVETPCLLRRLLQTAVVQIGIQGGLVVLVVFFEGVVVPGTGRFRWRQQNVIDSVHIRLRSEVVVIEVSLSIGWTVQKVQIVCGGRGSILLEDITGSAEENKFIHVDLNHAATSKEPSLMNSFETRRHANYVPTIGEEKDVVCHSFEEKECSYQSDCTPDLENTHESRRIKQAVAVGVETTSASSPSVTNVLPVGMDPKVITSKKNKPLLIKDGYCYHHHSYNKDKSRIYWRCENRSTCNARCITNVDLQNIIIYKINLAAHLHPPDGAAMQAKEVVQRIKQKASESPNEAPDEVMRQGMEGVVNEEILVKMPDRQNIKKMINLQQNRNRPVVPRSILDVNINHPYNVTKSNEQFLLYDSGRENSDRLLIFSTGNNMRLLAASDIILSDGTFKSVPPQFMQLYTVHEDLLHTFDELMDDLDELVVEFATYMETVYIRGRPGRGRRRATPPLFTPDIWNVYQLVLDGRQRTNNSVEGFHSKLGKVVVAHHANIWRFLENIKKIQAETEHAITQITGGHSRYEHDNFHPTLLHVSVTPISERRKLEGTGALVRTSSVNPSPFTVSMKITWTPCEESLSRFALASKEEEEEAEMSASATKRCGQGSFANGRERRFSLSGFCNEGLEALRKLIKWCDFLTPQVKCIPWWGTTPINNSREQIKKENKPGDTLVRCAESQPNETDENAKEGAKATACRTIHKASAQIGLRSQFIRMPTEAVEVQRVMRGFYDIPNQGCQSGDFVTRSGVFRKSSVGQARHMIAIFFPTREFMPSLKLVNLSKACF
ncbi:hypothetical protein C0J52_24135 [Blattella germanica]|nr:hypothetical protein C0J52_24135 [Blattella germanica]